MRKSLFFAGAILVLTACDNKKNNDEPAPDDIKMIKSISLEYPGLIMYRDIMQFTYDDNGRLVEMQVSESSRTTITTTLVYSQDGKRMEYTADSDVSDDNILFFYFNDDYRAEKIVENDYSYHELAYSNGYIAGYNYYLTSDKPGDWELEYTIESNFKWSNGNLVAIETVSHDHLKDLYDYTHINCEFSPLLNNYSIDPAMLFVLITEASYDQGAYFNTSIVCDCGYTNKNLMESFTSSSDGDENNSTTITFTYTADKSGYVTNFDVFIEYLQMTATVYITYY